MPQCCHTCHHVLSQSQGDNLVSAGESVVSGVEWDIGVFWNGCTTPGVPLDFQVERVPSWGATVNSGFLFWWSREMDPHLEMSREKRVSSWVLVRPTVFLSSGDRYVGELLELPQGFQGPFWGSRGKMGFLSRHHNGKGPHLALRWESPGFSKVVAGNVGFLWSYDRDLRDPLLLPQEIPVYMQVARGLLGFLSSLCQVLGPHLELRLELQGSSQLLTWISWFLWNFHRGVRPCLMWRHTSPFSSRAVTIV